MSHLRKPGGRDLAGWDSARSLQILPLGKKTSFYLVSADGLDVSIDDESVATFSGAAGDSKAAHKDGTLTDWEKSQVIRILSVTGKAPGTTTLHAKWMGGDWIEPLTIRVTQDPDHRQVGKDKAKVTPELRAELQGLSLRDAVIRVAEDQMNSRICRESDGFGLYNIDAQYNWCGAFAYWCWDQACAIKGVTNPFGTNGGVLWSPQKALHWAMKDTSWGQILRWGGTSPMDGKGRQEYREIGWSGYQLQRGDIVLLRKDKPNGWKHVCMVDSQSGTDLQTMDGNQGKKGATGVPCIKRVQRSLAATLTSGDYSLVFVHALGVPD